MLAKGVLSFMDRFCWALLRPFYHSEAPGVGITVEVAGSVQVSERCSGGILVGMSAGSRRYFET